MCVGMFSLNHDRPIPTWEKVVVWIAWAFPAILSNNFLSFIMHIKDRTLFVFSLIISEGGKHRKRSKPKAINEMIIKVISIRLFLEEEFCLLNADPFFKFWSINDKVVIDDSFLIFT